MKVVIIDYGAGNVFSVQQALLREGAEGIVSNDKQQILTADRIILPGVGHAKPALKTLKESGIADIIPGISQPFLGVCLGMQLLCGENEESGIPGLGIFETKVSMFSNNQIVPHMGWNDVVFSKEKSDAFYFVHSFKAEICAETWGTCNYDGDFSAALKKANFYGVQFHPEKSGRAGAQLLNEFLDQK